MITATERKKIAKLVLTSENGNMLDKIKSLISDENKAFIKQYNKEVDKAVERVRSGKFYSQDEADKLLAAWEKE